MAFTEDDAAIVRMVAAYRYVTPDLLARRLGRSKAVMRRRMRRELVPGGYIVEMPRAASESAAYTLGPMGFELLAHDQGVPVSALPFSRKITKVRTFLWKHTMLVNSIRVAFELACEADESPASLLRVIPEWEMNPGAGPKAPHHERFVLSARMGSGTRARSLRPDLGMLMHARGLDERMTLMLLEADRGSEDHGRLRSKIAAYRLYWEQARFESAFGAVDMRVLFVLDGMAGRARLDRLRADVASFADKGDGMAAFAACFRFASREDLDAGSVLTAPVWSDPWNRPRPFVRVQRPQEAA